MTSSTHNRFTKALVLGAIVAAAAAPVAGATGHPAGTRNAAVPDVLERYAAAHPFGTDALKSTQATDRIVDDYFRDAPTVVTSTPSGSGLDWQDFGIGAGAMLGLTLLVAGLALGAVAMRHHRGGRLETS
jgi:hypothetical protein